MQKKFRTFLRKSSCIQNWNFQVFANTTLPRENSVLYLHEFLPFFSSENSEKMRKTEAEQKQKKIEDLLFLFFFFRKPTNSNS